ncbi:MAG: DUF4933 domain-containing protein [Bacteroidetes bacterium]|nr:DUF4933 domain-containing protein [Bacteroidota bacterium]
MNRLFNIITLILICTNCINHKDPSVSEDKLISQINVQESQKTEEEKIAQLLRDSLASLPQGFRYQENRSVDPNRPPVVFQFPDTLPVREYKLSEIASELEYIVIKTSRDSTLFIPRVSVAMGTDIIVCYGLHGVELFDRQGNHIKTVLKNRGLSMRNGQPSGFAIKELVGIPFTDISLFNDSFIYHFHNGPEKKESVIRVDPDLGLSAHIQLGETISENPAAGTRIKEVQGMEFINKLGFYQLGDGLWAAFENKWLSGTKGDLLTLYGPSGDTLCQFKDYDRIRDYPGGPYRNTDNEFKYHYKKTFSFKPAHNDTLFRVIPPNRLLPTYVFDFGVRKVQLMEGLISSNSLKGKNIGYELYETERHLFYVYSRNRAIWGYYRPEDRNFFTLIDKSNHQIQHISSIKSTEDGIQNDLDGGLPFWPDGVNEEGFPFMYLSGADFKKKSVSKRINGLADNDIVVILAK